VTCQLIVVASQGKSLFPVAPTISYQENNHIDSAHLQVAGNGESKEMHVKDLLIPGCYSNGKGTKSSYAKTSGSTGRV